MQAILPTKWPVQGRSGVKVNIRCHVYPLDDRVVSDTKTLRT